MGEFTGIVRVIAHCRRFKIRRQASAPGDSAGRATDKCCRRLHAYTSNTHSSSACAVPYIAKSRDTRTNRQNDIIVTGRTREEHDTNLRAKLERVATRNLKLNPDKLTVGAQEVEYFGHILSADGLKPDLTKVKAIQDMPPPVDKKELETMLGISCPRRRSRSDLKDDSEFLWDQPQGDALDRTKAIILSQPVLSFFDPAKPIILQVDASRHDLGAALFQRGKARHFRIQEP